MQGYEPLLLLRATLDALIWLVRNEYPQDYSLADIGATWGEGFTDAMLAGLSALDGGTAEFLDRTVENRVAQKPEIHRS
jgi:hypothetical protein